MPASCVTCRFMDTNETGQTFCRRYPAQLVTLRGRGGRPDRVEALFPVVSPATDWCGEHSGTRMN